MTALERVMGRLQGLPTDRVPWFGLLSLYGARLTEQSMEKHYRDPDSYTAGVDAVVEKFGPDLLVLPFSVAMEAEAFGTRIRFPANGPPNLVIPDEAEASKWRARPDPDPASAPQLQFIRQSLTRMLARHGAERVVVAGLAGPLELAVALVGAEGLMDRLLFHPDEARALLEKTAAHFVRWTNLLFADGLPLGVFVGAFCNADVLTPELAMFVRPVLADALSQLKGPVVFHHGGGRLLGLLPVWKDMPAIVGYYMDHKDDMQQARILVGNAPVLLGNLNGPGLSALTPEAMEIQTGALLRQMDADPRFILGTSGADVPLDTREETILAIPRAIAAHAAARTAVRE